MIEYIKKTVLVTADKLRANMDAAEYKHIVLGLIFVKDIPLLPCAMNFFLDWSRANYLCRIGQTRRT